MARSGAAMNFELNEEQRLIQDTAQAVRRRGDRADARAGGAQARVPHRSRRQDGRARLLLLRAARGTRRQRHGLHGVGADGRADRQGLGLLAAAVQHAEPRAGADRHQIRHAGAEEEIRSRLGRRHAARLLRHDRAQHRLGRRQHEDPRRSTRATTARSTATRCGSRRRTSATPACSTPTPTGPRATRA